MLFNSSVDCCWCPTISDCELLLFFLTYDLCIQFQVDKLQEELAAEYLKYRDECDARKILISDMNDLRNQQEDMVMSQQAMEEEEEKDDPITLKIALKYVKSTNQNACYNV